jgi:hypothetical protein
MTVASFSNAFLTNEELTSLSFDHKYKASGCSILDRLFMRDFWTWLVVSARPDTQRSAHFKRVPP